MENIYFKSFWAGIKKYKKPVYGIGLIMASTSLFSFFSNVLDISISEFFSAILSAYQEIFIDPINLIFSLIGIPIPNWCIEVSLVYFIFGTALARTRMSIEPELEEQYGSGSKYLIDQRKYEKPNETWLSIKYLFMPMEFRWVEPRPKSRLVRIVSMTRTRFYKFYEQSPLPLRVALDVIFLPIALIAFLNRPVVTYLDNQNNPEDCQYIMESALRVRKNTEAFEDGRTWINTVPIFDFRYFLIGQILSVFFFTIFLFVLNSALFK